MDAIEEISKLLLRGFDQITNSGAAMPLSKGDWSLLFEGLTAVGTVGAVVVALFHDRIKEWLGRPKLEIVLRSKEGEYQQGTRLALPGRQDGEAVANTTLIASTATHTFISSANPSVEIVDTWWMHLRVSNRRAWSPATDVRAYLTKVETLNAGGTPTMRWQGEVPLNWRNQEYNPKTRTIGPGFDADLCSIQRGITDIIVAVEYCPSSLRAALTGNSQFIVTVVAQGLQSRSELLRLKIAWNGMWDMDPAKMCQHFVVEVV